MNCGQRDVDIIADLSNGSNGVALFLWFEISCYFENVGTVHYWFQFGLNEQNSPCTDRSFFGYTLD